MKMVLLLIVIMTPIAYLAMLVTLTRLYYNQQVIRLR